MNSVKVIHGPNADTFDGIAGASVTAIRSSLRDAFNVPGEAWAFANGRRVGRDYRIRGGDVVEYICPWGHKGAIPTNEYGHVVIVNGVPGGLVHVDQPRLGPTCKKLGIAYAKAVVDWSEFRSRGHHKRYPVFSGVVIEKSDHPKLMEALAKKAEKAKHEIERLSVLDALFTLNRRAKRCRDLAQEYYQSGMHGFAGEMRREKGAIYDSKGQVLHHLVQAGVLSGGKFHIFPGGNWAEVLRGEGYSFHRPCPPQEGGRVIEEIDSIEATPKASKEPTLQVARRVIDNFLQGKDRAAVYEWPARTRTPRYRVGEDDEYREDDFDDRDDDFDDRDDDA